MEEETFGRRPLGSIALAVACNEKQRFGAAESEGGPKGYARRSEAPGRNGEKSSRAQFPGRVVLHSTAVDVAPATKVPRVFRPDAHGQIPPARGYHRCGADCSADALGGGVLHQLPQGPEP
jgi:hypothetical protein